ncbi:MAG: hypothetical protein F7C81_06770 [Desulfurococcales archaeon]|nr:hypothetical protein [Desulfurococcales archaeon]
MLMVVLGLVGLIAGVMSYINYRRETSVVCRADEGPSGCKLVYMIPQAWFMGIHFSVLAPIYFTLILATTVIDIIYESPSYTGLILWLLYLVGLGFVPYLIYLEVKVARAICLWCTIMHICIILGALMTTMNLM